MKEQKKSRTVINYFFKSSIKTNEGATVKWQFKSRAEYITVGSRLIFREGNTKGLGEVTKIYPCCVDSPEQKEKTTMKEHNNRGKSASPTELPNIKSKIQKTSTSCSIADMRNKIEPEN